mgnify:CR=1 FL=1
MHNSCGESARKVRQGKVLQGDSGNASPFRRSMSLTEKMRSHQQSGRVFRFQCQCIQTIQQRFSRQRVQPQRSQESIHRISEPGPGAAAAQRRCHGQLPAIQERPQFHSGRDLAFCNLFGCNHQRKLCACTQCQEKFLLQFLCCAEYGCLIIPNGAITGIPSGIPGTFRVRPTILPEGTIRGSKYSGIFNAAAAS